VESRTLGSLASIRLLAYSLGARPAHRREYRGRGYGKTQRPGRRPASLRHPRRLRAERHRWTSQQCPFDRFIGVPPDIASFIEVPTQESTYWYLRGGKLTSDSDRVWAELVVGHPVLAYHRRTADGRALRISDVASRAAIRKLPIYQEYYRQLGVEHMVGLSLVTTPPTCGDRPAAEAA
jgi:hypothetical protein